MEPAKPWARNYTECQKCGETKFEHAGKGLCSRCYSRKRYQQMKTLSREHGDNYVWSSRFPFCQNCGTTQLPYAGKGLCTKCYHYQRRNGSPRPVGGESKLKWSRKYDRCRECGRTDIPHLALGFCKQCYYKQKRPPKPDKLDRKKEMSKRASEAWKVPETRKKIIAGIHKVKEIRDKKRRNDLRLWGYLSSQVLLTRYIVQELIGFRGNVSDILEELMERKIIVERREKAPYRINKQQAVLEARKRGISFRESISALGGLRDKLAKELAEKYPPVIEWMRRNKGITLFNIQKILKTSSRHKAYQIQAKLDILEITTPGNKSNGRQVDSDRFEEWYRVKEVKKITRKMKAERQAEIVEIIKNRTINTQGELRNILREKGWDVTQATVSRDIKEMRAIAKVSTDTGGYKYVILPSVV